MLTEATRTSVRGRISASEKSKTESKSRVLEQIADHVLLDGFRIVIDLEKSKGSYLFDAAHDRRLIDLYGFFGSNPVGFNHPHFDKPEVKADLLRAAKIKIANSDVYSEGYAKFLETFWRVVGLPPLERMLLIEAARSRSRTRSRPRWIGRCAKTWRPAAANAGPRSSISATPSTAGAATP